MDIPEDVEAQALAADDTWAFLVEWARKQTLDALADEAETSFGWKDPDDAHRAAVWIRRRALGTPNGEQ